MLSTHRDIALVSADLDLRTFLDRLPLLIRAEIHRRLRVTVANRLELREMIGPSQQSGTPRGEHGRPARENLGPEPLAQGIDQPRKGRNERKLPKLSLRKPSFVLFVLFVVVIQRT
jgi:hypothetical protein